MNSKTFKTFAVMALISAGLAGASLFAGQVNAASDSRFTDLIAALSQRFGLDQTELTTFFAEQKEARADARLDGLVEDGTLTQAQRDAVEAKQDEQQAKREEIADASLTASERREALETLREEMRTWLEEQGIDLPFAANGRHGSGPGRGERMEMML
jgi:hypothetical protein